MSVTANTDNMGTATGVTASVTAAVEQKLTQLKLSRLREVYPHWVKEAEAHQLSYLEFLDGLLAEEVVGRQENQMRRQLKAAGFPFAATLEQFDFSLHPELKRAVMVRFFDRTFVEQAQSLVLVGASGLRQNPFGDCVGHQAGAARLSGALCDGTSTGQRSGCGAESCGRDGSAAAVDAL